MVDRDGGGTEKRLEKVMIEGGKKLFTILLIAYAVVVNWECNSIYSHRTIIVITDTNIDSIVAEGHQLGHIRRRRLHIRHISHISHIRHIIHILERIQ